MILASFYDKAFVGCRFLFPGVFIGCPDRVHAVQVNFG
jgi:hypothetical protein